MPRSSPSPPAEARQGEGGPVSHSLSELVYLRSQIEADPAATLRRSQTKVLRKVPNRAEGDDQHTHLGKRLG